MCRASRGSWFRIKIGFGGCMACVGFSRGWVFVDLNRFRLVFYFFVVVG